MRYRRTVELSIRLWPDADRRTGTLSGTVEIETPKDLTRRNLSEGIRETLAELRNKYKAPRPLPDFDEFARTMETMPHGPQSMEWAVTVVKRPVRSKSGIEPGTGLIKVTTEDITKDGERKDGWDNQE